MNEIKTATESDLIFLPHIRASDNTSLERLESMGFFLLETEGESVVNTRTEPLHDYLRTQVGGKTYREHLRLTRRSQPYQITTFTYDELINRSSLYSAWCELFVQHERKYGNDIAPYGRILLDELKDTQCRHEYRFNVRFHDEDVVQVYLTKHGSDTLFLIASAANSDVAPSGVNLYTTMMIEVLQQSESLGFQLTHLGRGGRQRKIKYGANQYTPHIHAVYTKDQAAQRELELGGI